MGDQSGSGLTRPARRSKPPAYLPGSEEAVATDTNTTSDDRIGGYRYIRTIHPGPPPS